KGAKTRAYQIDVYAKEQRQNRVWLCECKYTKTKMGMPQVDKLEQAAEALKQEVEEVGAMVPEVQFWLVSTGGFTEEVIRYANGRNDMYASDYGGINGLFQAFGGNYNIPVFQQE
ncbi:MAG: hypothetical protein GY801_03195, partial [bacterium]|nr:hypothetical protein [bacterium]